MPKVAGTREYYENIRLWAEKHQITYYEAEIDMLYFLIEPLRMVHHMKHRDIQKHLHETFGLGMNSYRTRLKRIRTKHLLP